MDTSFLLRNIFPPAALPKQQTSGQQVLVGCEGFGAGWVSASGTKP
jgi:hypothetical protein